MGDLGAGIGMMVTVLFTVATFGVVFAGTALVGLLAPVLFPIPAGAIYGGALVVSLLASAFTSHKLNS